MHISILTTITNPEERQDRWKEALHSYCDFADEVVVVDGSELSNVKNVINLFANELDSGKIKLISMPWPYEWNFKELPLHLNAGLEEATGDWVIKMDIDQIIHENDFEEIRKRFEMNNDKDAVTFQKMSPLPFGKLNQKGEMLVALNKAKVGDTVCFGDVIDTPNDLCQLIVKEGTNEKGIPYGKLLSEVGNCGRTGVSIWNFDYFFKTEEFTRKEFPRFSRAFLNYFGYTNWGHDDKESFDIFINMMKGRTGRASQKVDTDSLPRYIKEEYMKIDEKQFGHSAWGYFNE